MIETARLLIRLPKPGDVPEIIHYYSTNRSHLQPYSPTFGPDFLDEAAWLEQVRKRELEFQAGESFRAFLFARPEDRRIVGNINLTQVHRGAFHSCGLGYNLAASEQGKGYMTEAVGAVVRFAFTEWRLHRVAADYLPRNVRSGAVLERCGFKVEGRAPAYLLIDGRWEDHVLTAITNPDWPGPTATS
jgi:ribosomal-protein-alanine N-acetyltransferase